jgi:hypothetical protein
MIFSSLSRFGNGLEFPIFQFCDGFLLISRPAPDLVTICRFFEFNTSGFGTLWSKFTVFLFIILSSTIKQSSSE